MITRHVYLGRFAPFHKGHKLLLDEMVKQFGQEAVLVMIGSTNTLNRRTPYTFEARKKIINTSFPNLEILPLPDGRPNLEYFDGSTNDIWLGSIGSIAKSRDEKFIFYGGAPVDLEVLSQRFETRVIVSRDILKISATQVRELIEKKDLEKLGRLVDPKAVDIIINEYKNLYENWTSSNRGCSSKS